MLFNSNAFIFFFLPVSFLVYFLLNRYRLTMAAKAWLVFASLFFYSWWNVRYLALILSSITFNYAVGAELSRSAHDRMPITRKQLLQIGIVANLALLGYFKYADFFVENLNRLTGGSLPLLRIVLPLGISFFTFTQIAFLVDAYRREMKEYSFLNYSLFVTYFPHLLAGPILHHKEMMGQFDVMRNKVINNRHLFQGLCLFVIGLFKKVLVADQFASFATSGFDAVETLRFLEAWTASLSYTMQIYFDFSGYTDMALGMSLLFNIRLPINFNSPYQALTIQEFWRRWHMTLSRFMRDYIYIPLGGNRSTELMVSLNLFLTFLIGGLWHGAGWTFVAWGAAHGVAMVLHRQWERMGVSLPRPVAWFITFNFVNAAWVFFRAKSFSSAVNVLKGMIGMNGIVLPQQLGDILAFLSSRGVQFGNALTAVNGANLYSILELAIAFAVVLLARNSNTIVGRIRPTPANAALMAVMTITAILKLGRPSEFIYFNF